MRAQPPEVRQNIGDFSLRQHPPVRARCRPRRAGFEAARSAMRDFTLLLALAWGAAEVALWLNGG
ncbi:MAG: hypothetical protein ACK5WN_21635 [Alphaproteobacteria bacterium]